MPTAHQHWAYVWIPVVGAIMWCGTLLAMIITWAAQGKPIYVSEDGTIPYISDIGADILKPLFIVGCAITGVSFFLSLVVERWLRHSGRLIPTMRRRERVFSGLAILGSFIGGCGLILLSIFDTKRHTSLHRVFLLVFIVGVGLSAIFTVIEYRWISHDFVELRKLKLAYIAKGIIATILILCAIAFAIALYQSTNVGAVLEWTIAFGYTFFLLTFFYDLRMAKGMHKGDLARERLVDMREAGIPVSAATAGHEGDEGARRGYDRGAYPDGYAGAHGAGRGSANGSGNGYGNGYEGGADPGSVRTNGTAASAMMQQPPFAGNDRGANRYAVRGYA